MKRSAWLLLWLALAVNVDAQTINRQNISNFLGFENGTPGNYPAGWGGSGPGTIFTDNVVAHSGKYSARIQRTATSANPFSTITGSLPVDFVADTLQWRGFFKTEDVGGFVALWLRVDGDTSVLSFDTLQGLNLDGTRDWEQYSVSVSVPAGSRMVYFGFFLDGPGKAWVDDLQLTADGINISSAPTQLRPTDTDHEFDQGSRITLNNISDVQRANLYTLGKVWGFVKYHHPNITIGTRHWDYELFRVLPKILAASDSATANAAMSAWIDGLGAFPYCGPCASLTYGNLYLTPDLDWIKDESLLGADLSSRLQDIYANRRMSPKQYYVYLSSGASNPIFDKELSYAAVRFPDPGFQLLALYRFWNMVQYFYPDRDIIADDPVDREYWNRVLKEEIPAVALAPSALGYQQELMRLIVKINDTHANLWSSISSRPPIGQCQLPVDVRFVEGRPIVIRQISSAPGTDPASLQNGDIIEKLDGVAIADLVKEWRPLYADSNEAARLRDIGFYMTQGACGPAPVTVQRGDAHLNITPTRIASYTLNLTARSTHDRPGAAFQKLSDNVAYLKLSAVTAANSANYIEQARGTKGLIIDIRNYPSEFVVFTLGQLLVADPTEFVRFSYGDVANPGAFRLRPSTLLIPQEPHYAGKVVILIDEITQSQAEYTTMAFRTAPNAIVIGSTTAGADGNVSAIALPGALNSQISGLGVYYPDGRPTQRVGIIPDIEVRPTIAGIRAGRDELLEEAIRQIDKDDSDVRPATAFALNGRGTASLRTPPQTPVLNVGYASIQPSSGYTPSGVAIFGLRQNDVLVSEAGVPASVPLQSGRIFADMNASVSTGLAIANPNAQRVTISYYFSDASGNSGAGSTVIEGKGQISAFLNQMPFHGKSVFSGTFTFTSSLPVAAVALRGLTNERGEFLLTTMPVGDLKAAPITTALVFPHFAEGAGWTTQIVLTNPTDTTLSGTVEFRNPAGTLSTSSGFVYAIPPRASQKFQTAGTGAVATVGSVRVVPTAGMSAPFAVTIFSLRKNGTVVSEAGVPAIPAGNSFRLYAEATGDFSAGAIGSMQTGLAIANPSSSPASVTLELFNADGSSTGLTESLAIPANGQFAGFLKGLSGLSKMQTPFQGTLRVSSSSPVSVIGLRGRYNERTDFLMTTTAPANDATPPSLAPSYFPHLAFGAGYSTQFILFEAETGVVSSGVLSLFAQTGALMNAILQ